jgi:hypothetical protein
MDIPSLFMIPSAVSSGKVHSVFPNSTDADFDFNRDSDATRVNSEGLIERVGYYGSELITNGDFATDSNWTKGAGWTIANGKATVTSSITDSIYQDALTLGKTFKVTFQITNITSGSLRVGIGINFSDYFTEVGTYTFYGQPSNDTLLRINPSSGTNASIDNVSVKEITGDRARLNYEIEGGLVNTKPSLLLEPQSTNLVTYSDDFSQSAWQKLSSGTASIPVVTTNQGLAPDGNNTADKIFFDRGTGSSSGDFSRLYFSTGSAPATMSVYLKSFDGLTYDMQIVCANSSKNISITSDWQRFDVSESSSGSNWQLKLVGNLGTNATSSILVWGAQLEALSYATSYIPTNGSTQTRAAETCNGAGTSSIFESSEGILYCEIAALTDLGSYRLISLSDGTSVSNRITILYNIADNQIYGQCVASSSTQAFVLFEPTSISDFHKIAFKYKANDFQLWVDGVKVGTDTSGSAPTGLSMLSFDRADGVDDWYGKVRDIRVYNTKEMTDSEVDILLTKITS